MQQPGVTPACVPACRTLHVPLSAMPCGSVSRSLALLVALASPQPSHGQSLATRHAAHYSYASWAASWPNVTHMFPAAALLSTAELATSTLQFAVGLRDLHASTNRALTALEDNLNQHPLRTPPRPYSEQALLRIWA